MKRLRNIVYGAGLLIVLLCVAACKTSEDAIAAAQQMAETSAALSHFYAAVSETLRETIAVNELNSSILSIPFQDADRNRIQETRLEIDRRAQMATALANLSSSFGSLARSKAPADAEGAATRLGNQLVGLKALPGGPPIPELLGKAAGVLLQLVQQHQEKKAAQAMDDTLTALVDLYSKEKPVYDSIARQHLVVAKAVTTVLIQRQAVDSRPLLASVLRPFDLDPLPPGEAMQTTLAALAKARLDRSADDLVQREENASSAMLLALQQMSARVHLLALGRPMPSRGKPSSLDTVEAWLDVFKEVL